jgi:hypothetical protein
MISNDFYGKKPFVWWTGIVEDVVDPLKLGSIRVRIIGLHSLDKTQVPTESLPWAQVAKPTTGANTTSGPREGDWVFGFFQDSEQAQIPVVLGIFPGVESKQSQIVYQEAAAREGANTKPVSTQVDRVVGEPTTSRISRGVLEGTLVNFTNNNLEHVCDISKDVKKAVTWIRAQFGYVVEAIRKAIRALLKFLGLDPSGTSTALVQKLKDLAREIKKYGKYITDFNEQVLELVKLARDIRAEIDYILSLPDKLRALLQDCLVQLYTALARGFTDLLASPEGGFLGTGVDTSELQSAFDEISVASGEIYNSALETISIPGQIIEAVLTPASPEAIAAAGAGYEAFAKDSADKLLSSAKEYSVPSNTIDKRAMV